MFERKKIKRKRKVTMNSRDFRRPLRALRVGTRETGADARRLLKRRGGYMAGGSGEEKEVALSTVEVVR